MVEQAEPWVGMNGIGLHGLSFWERNKKKEFFAQEFSEHMYFFAKSVRHIEFLAQSFLNI